MHRNYNGNIFLFALVVLHVVIVKCDQNPRNVMKGKIVGGKPVDLEQYPFVVQFFNLGAFCGGVIVNSWSILTSAHCFNNNKDIDEMRIQVGSKYIYDFKAKRYKLSSFVIHEDYNKEILFQYDIAIMFVEEKITFSELIQKAILVDSDKWMNKGEKNFIVTGWGWTKYGGPLSKLGLMMTYLQYVPLDECSRMHRINLSIDMFCLYGDGFRDTCKGDSGGGVLWNGMIVGLTSHGDGCAKKGKPSVYTNIWHLRHWIKEQVLKYMNYYCTSHSTK